MAITIGNFDGVHVGHVQLVRTARSIVSDDGRVVVLSFDPHPITVLRGGDPGRLTTFAERTRLLKEVGADEVVPLNPTPQFLSQEPEQFLTAVIDPYRPGVIVEGPDFHFGRGRAGSVQTLRELEGKHGYRTVVIDPVEIALTDQKLVRVSSTMVRRLVEWGRMRDVILLLGRPYELIGPVVEGDRRGRSIGVPTANLDHIDHLLPGDGIYTGVGCLPDGRRFPAAVSCGTKPTFGEHPRLCEAHLIGYDGPLDEYGWTLRLQITDWLRDQIRYDDVDLLRAQMSRDIARAGALCPING
ncbi:MAG: riboflavin kinase [Planctomycetota bacterium]|nr:riboflavin kinase [Planctomycetota bacterium]